MKRFLTILILAVTTCAMGCSQPDSSESISKDEQDILFIFQNLNYSDGYQHRGFYVTTDGMKHTYDVTD